MLRLLITLIKLFEYYVVGRTACYNWYQSRLVRPTN